MITPFRGTLGGTHRVTPALPEYLTSTFLSPFSGISYLSRHEVSLQGRQPLNHRMSHLSRLAIPGLFWPACICFAMSGCELVWLLVFKVDFGDSLSLLAIPRRVERDRSRFWHRRERSYTPPHKVRRRAEETRTQEVQDWSAMMGWQNSASTPFVSQNPMASTQMNYMPAPPAPFLPPPGFHHFPPLNFTQPVPAATFPPDPAPRDLGLHQTFQYVRRSSSSSSPGNSSSTASCSSGPALASDWMDAR